MPPRNDPRGQLMWLALSHRVASFCRPLSLAVQPTFLVCSQNFVDHPHWHGCRVGAVACARPARSAAMRPVAAFSSFLCLSLRVAGTNGPSRNRGKRSRALLPAGHWCWVIVAECVSVCALVPPLTCACVAACVYRRASNAPPPPPPTHSRPSHMHMVTVFGSGSSSQKQHVCGSLGWAPTGTRRWLTSEHFGGEYQGVFCVSFARQPFQRHSHRVVTAVFQ